MAERGRIALRRVPDGLAGAIVGVPVDHGLAAGALLAYVTALGEFVASVLLYTPSTRPISIEILSQLRAYDFGTAAAYGVVLIVLMTIVFVFGQRVVADEGLRRGAG